MAVALPAIAAAVGAAIGGAAPALIAATFVTNLALTGFTFREGDAEWQVVIDEDPPYG